MNLRSKHGLSESPGLEQKAKGRIKKFALLAVLVSLLVREPNAQPRPEPEREFRAVWIATVDNIDFPTKRALTVEKQKEELIASLDLAKKLRLNAVIFQVRPMADAVYRSKIEPWSEFLTGEMGKPQDFDPLEFIVAEAHKRGILVHAWFNPYRAYHPAAKTMSDDHVARRKPTTVRQYGRYMWLDPTSPEAQRHSLEVIEDVVRRYDIDGVHFDDYFYPYAEKDAAGNEIDFPDDPNWLAYQKTGGKLTRDDWRRSNVNSFIEAVGRAIKKIKPDVVYGISPFGIWQPIPERDIAGFNSYAKLYADSRKWLQDGTVDYLAPQLYWETSRKGLSFPVLLNWWNEQNTKRRFVWPGVAAYRIGSTPTFTTGEIASQIQQTRRSPETKGAIYFSFKSLRNDMGGIQGLLRDHVYSRDAVIPEFTWIKSRRPSKPKSLRAIVTRGFLSVSWKLQKRSKVFWFVVNVKSPDGWRCEILPASETAIKLSDPGAQEVWITSIDRLGKESEPARFDLSKSRRVVF